MPTYKAIILKNVNYVENEKDKLVEAIKSINSKLDIYGNQHGKISDNKLLILLAITLQAELTDLKKNKEKERIQKKFEEQNIENIGLNDKLYKLRKQNEFLKKESELLNQALSKLQKEIDLIIHLIKTIYDE